MMMMLVRMVHSNDGARPKGLDEVVLALEGVPN
jgi:hypothetical protein